MRIGLMRVLEKVQLTVWGAEFSCFKGQLDHYVSIALNEEALQKLVELITVLLADPTKESISASLAKRK